MEEALASRPVAPDCEPVVPLVPLLPKRSDPSPPEAAPSPPWLLLCELPPCRPLPWLPPRLLRHWLNSSLKRL